MRRRSGLLSLLLIACARPAASPPDPPPTIAVTIAATTPATDAVAIARWSAARDPAGPIAETRADTGATTRTRAAAIAALGHIGDPAAIARLLELTRAPEAELRVQASVALGIAAALGTKSDDAEAHVLAAWALADPRGRADLAAALGRLGTAAAVPTLAAGVEDSDATLVEAAAVALGVLGRRGVAWDAQAGRAVLALAARDPEPALAYAAAYALAHAPVAAPREPVDAALLRLARATDAETRAVALVGLARRKVAASVARSALQDALADANPWVRVAAVRGLMALADETASAAVLAWARAQIGAGVLNDPTRAAAAHPIFEALERLTSARDRGDPPTNSSERSAAPATPPPPRPERTTKWTKALSAAQREAEDQLARAPTEARPLAARAACQLAAAVARDERWRPPLRCADGVTAVDLAVLEAGVIGAGFGGDDRRPRLEQLFADADPRVRAAAATAAGSRWLVDQPAIEALWRRALVDPSSAVIGAAVDAIAARASSFLKKKPSPALLADLVARATRDLRADVELYTGIAAALATIGDPSALPACEAGLRHPGPAVREAARACVTKLARDPGPQTPSQPPATPPHDPAAVLGKTVSWRLTTARGVLDIELDPAAAPWHVATLVALTRAGFYDGLVFHRVVPGFVVQGGDPQGTGWGGPGFTLPSEASAGRFERGAVGIADAGKDSGGSQFFVMHARAPHLEGRYTRVGALRRGHEVADALQLGDRIVRAEVTAR